MEGFNQTISELWNQLNSHQVLVLSTSCNNRVSSRQVSVIIHGGKFYFQTDKNYLKFKQLYINPNASFCFNKYSIEGKCKCIGKPTDEKNSFFLDLFREHFYPAYKLYSGLETECLMEFTPTLIYKWDYENSIPYMEYWYFNEQKYVKKYIGELNEKQISQTEFT